ncbi:MAG: acetyl-CoA carboxylase, biotin carboxyl carrier protein [Acidobacteria bacterium RIFCSPLOWO2_12_FULL_60_22]|nr:MAG: acetyl-CoA carboxylase, biotin carboxyl carrier protein [Acidobacteria bacterium RIFCSPLOWO2_12_FULL_60_22]
MNLKEIKELIDLITEKGISEFELERSGVRLKISRNAAPRTEGGILPADTRPAVASISTPAPQLVSGTPSSPSAEAPLLLEGLHVVRSPMVGTFYLAPTQGAPPFIQVGDRIQVGQVLCIIEAMKLMNEIEAEIAGEVIKCYVENGQPVEYGEPLFDLRPAVSSKKHP